MLSRITERTVMPLPQETGVLTGVITFPAIILVNLSIAEHVFPEIVTESM